MSDLSTTNPAKAGVVAPVVKHPQGSPTGPLDAAVNLQDGAEDGVARFCEEAFVTPESTRQGAEALLSAFDNSGLWLSNLVHPSHILAELRQSSCTLTRVIVTQWTKQGETHKLSRLGVALLEAQPPLRTHEAGQVMALLAGLLGVLRPPRAQSLLENARPLLRDSTDLQLLIEANEWVAIGRALENLSSEDRLFWNRRLREPGEGWDWDTAEARGALLRLAPLIKILPDEDLPRFQSTLPGCWWDVIHKKNTAVSTSTPFTFGNLKPNDGIIFAVGLAAGIIIMTIAGPLLRSDNAATPGSVAKTPQAVEKIETLLASQASKHPQAADRQAELSKMTQEYGELQRLHNIVKTGTLRENGSIIYGRSSMAAMGSPPYLILIRWLMLDPPDQADVRLAVAKMATRALPPDELLSTLRMCIYPGSPNDEEARQCATWTLELGANKMTESQKRELSALPKTMARS